MSRINCVMRIALCLALSLGLCATAFADAGTGLMWAGMLHMVIGNFLIVLIEAPLLAYFLKVRVFAGLFIMALFANYFSAALGAFLLVPDEFKQITFPLLFSLQLSAPITQALRNAPFEQLPVMLPSMLAALYLLAYVLSVVAEAPFIFIAMRYISAPRPARKTVLRAVILVNLITWLPLIGWYQMLSPMSLLKNAKFVASPDFIKVKNAVVYFNAPDSNLVTRYTFDGQPPQAMPGITLDSLFKKYISVDVWQYHPAFPASGVTLDLRDQTQQNDVKAYCGGWAAEGLRVRKNTEIINLALETPVSVWYSTNATILPEDQIIYQLDDRILLFDVYTRKLAEIARGENPVVSLGDKTWPVRQSSN